MYVTTKRDQRACVFDVDTCECGDDGWKKRETRVGEGGTWGASAAAEETTRRADVVSPRSMRRRGVMNENSRGSISAGSAEYLSRPILWAGGR